MAKILLVDDDVDHNTMVRGLLSKEHHVIDVATTGENALYLLDVSVYDVIVLDWSLPDMSGLDVLRQYRSNGRTPVLMLTGKGAIGSRTEGLDSGADDYLIKPFSAAELSSRIRALLRRPVNFIDTPLSAGGYTFNSVKLTVTMSGKEIRLTPLEFAVLEFLARHPNQLFKGDALIARVWQSDTGATTDSLRTIIMRIRKKLQDENVIQTVGAAGYTFGGNQDNS